MSKKKKKAAARDTKGDPRLSGGTVTMDVKDSKTNTNLKLSFKVEGSESFTCPFCQGQVTASNRPAIVLHSLPMCESFTKLDALEFLSTARRARGISDADMDRILGPISKEGTSP